DNIIAEIVSGSVGNGVVMATANPVNGSSVPATSDWVRFTFDSLPLLSASTEYFVRLQRTGARDTSNYYRRSQDILNPYAGGASYVYRTDTGLASATLQDLRFRAYSAVGSPTVEA